MPRALKDARRYINSPRQPNSLVLYFRTPRRYQTPISSPVGSPSLTEHIVITSINIASPTSKASYLKSDRVHSPSTARPHAFPRVTYLRDFPSTICLLISQLCRGTDKNAVLDPSIRDQEPGPVPSVEGHNLALVKSRRSVPA